MATPTVLADRGAIQANSTPSGARVAVDGVDKGTAPLLIPDVPAGPHTVRFSLDGYVEREQPVDVRAGQTATLSANLTPANRTRSGVPCSRSSWPSEPSRRQQPCGAVDGDKYLRYSTPSTRRSTDSKGNP